MKAELSRKQEIYLEIYGRVLPLLRNMQTHSVMKRLTYGSFYDELELVHNMHDLVVNFYFSEFDVHWINSQGLPFILKKDKRYGIRKVIARLIVELIELLPPDLKKDVRITNEQLQKITSGKGSGENGTRLR